MPVERRPAAAVIAAVPPAFLALALQYGRYAAVGAAATLLHVLAYAAAVAWWGVPPLAANALGFAAAVNVSFVGHRRWTFRAAADAPARRGSLARFWAVALAGFALNSLLVQLITGTLGLPYGWAVPAIAGATPVATFALSRLWAFRPA